MTQNVSESKVESDLKRVAEHEEKVGEAIDQSLHLMENYDEWLYSSEKKGDLTANKAVENLKSIIVAMENRIERIEEGVDTLEDEVETVDEEVQSYNGDKFDSVDEAVKNNLELAEEVLDFLEEEYNRIESILNKVENGESEDSLNQIKVIEERDAERLNELGERFEQEWAQLLN